MKSEIVLKTTEPNQITKIEQIFTSLPVNTQKAYKKSITDYLDFMNTGINELDKITLNEIVEYIENLKNRYSLSTVNVKLSGIKKLYNVISVVTGIDNPFEKLKAVNIKTNFSVKHKSVRDKVISRTEAKQLSEYYTKSGKPVFSVIVKMLFGHGLRISELLSIKQKDIKRTGASYAAIRIIGKGSKERFITIDKDLYNSVKAIAGDDDLIFPGLSRHNVTMNIKRTALKILDKNITAHCLRHSFATNLNQNRPEMLKAISKYLGHSTTAITSDLYIHQELTENDLQIIGI